MLYYCIMSNRHLKDISFVQLNISNIDDALKNLANSKNTDNLIGIVLSDEMGVSLNNFFSLNENSYNYTYLDPPFTDETTHDNANRLISLGTEQILSNYFKG